MTDLAGDQLQALGMKAAAKRSIDPALTIPAQFDHARFEAARRDGECKTAGTCAGVKYDIRSVTDRFMGVSVGSDEAGSERFRDRSPVRIEVAHHHVCARQTGCDERDKKTDDTGADNDDFIARPGAAVPDRIERRFHVCSQRGACHWKVAW